jgi:hypothetical protein
LIQFVSRTPTLKALEYAHLHFEDGVARIDFFSHTSGYGSLKTGILCRESDWQVLSLEQVCISCLPPLSAVKDLCIYQNPYNPYLDPHRQDNVDNTLWLELLHLFTAVKNLYISTVFVPRIAPALLELVGGRTTEVLLVLQNIFLQRFRPSEPVQEGIQQFVTMRQVTGRPIAVSRWVSTYHPPLPFSLFLGIIVVGLIAYRAEWRQRGHIFEIRSSSPPPSYPP